MERLREILKSIYSSVPNTEFIGIVNLSEGMTVEMWTERWSDHADIISAALSEIGRFINEKKRKARNDAIREALKHFIELIIETERGYFIIRNIDDTDYSIGAAMGKEGNLGLLRSQIGLYSEEIKKELL